MIEKGSFVEGTWAMSAFAGLGVMYGLLSLLSGRDELRLKMEDAQRTRNSRLYSIDHWRLLSKAYAEIVRTAEEQSEKKEAGIQIKMLGHCIAEYEREIIEIDAFIERAREECEKREKAKHDVDSAKSEKHNAALRRIVELEETVKRTEEAMRLVQESLDAERSRNEYLQKRLDAQFGAE